MTDERDETEKKTKTQQNKIKKKVKKEKNRGKKVMRNKIKQKRNTQIQLSCCTKSQETKLA